MDLTDVANARLVSQQIARTKTQTIKELVGWMGAIQAQDFPMSKLAIGSRLPGTTDQLVEAAFARGDILRTHLLRPTWHIVSADDIYWLLDLTAPQVMAASRPRHRDLGLTEDVIAKSNAVIEKALTGGKHLTREELVSEFEKVGIATGDNRSSHILAQAELQGLLCSGASRAGKPTYALLEERIPRQKPIGKDEALAKLAGRYFLSHGPATLQDFTWWSGLAVGEARRALEMIKSEYNSEKIDSQTFWFNGEPSMPKSKGKSIYLLPAFDEFIISYTDRRATLLDEHFSRAVSANGMFRPVIVADGQVVGLWKRTPKKGSVIVEADFFSPPDDATTNLARQAALRIAEFLEKMLEFHPFAKIEPFRFQTNKEN
ncbi:MAG TPA: winged helix DNA-binding domain-containing protein [Anaerolineales bacterium]|jgi:hypothetical protein